MKICVIGHTHNLNTIDKLPNRAKLALTEADLILHVGNVGSLFFLNALQDKYGLTFAVYGNQDSHEVQRYLEAQKVVKFANRQIGMAFCATGLGPDVNRLSLKRPALAPDAISKHLTAMFNQVDCIVFGYPQQPVNHLYNGYLIFNPGQIDGAAGDKGTMGILDVTDKSIAGRIVTL